LYSSHLLHSTDIVNMLPNVNRTIICIRQRATNVNETKKREKKYSEFKNIWKKKLSIKTYYGR